VKLHELNDKKTFHGFNIFLIPLLLQAISKYFNFVVFVTNTWRVYIQIYLISPTIYFIIMLVLLDVCTYYIGPSSLIIVCNNPTSYFSKFCELDPPIQPSFCNEFLEIGYYKREILE
jgi:hypothetical protein